MSEQSDPDPDFDLNTASNNRLLTIFKSFKPIVKTPEKVRYPELSRPNPNVSGASSSRDDYSLLQAAGLARKKFTEESPETIQSRPRNIMNLPTKQKPQKRIKIADNDDYTTEEENFHAVTRPGMNSSSIHQIKKDIHKKNSIPAISTLRSRRMGIINSMDYVPSNRLQKAKYSSPQSALSKNKINDSIQIRSILFKSSHNLIQSDLNSPKMFLSNEASPAKTRVPFQLIRNSRSLFPLNKQDTVRQPTNAHIQPS